MDSNRILIIDYGSQFTQLIARRIREERVYCEIHPPTRSVEWIREWAPSGIILSGGPSSVYWDDEFHASACELMARCAVKVPDNFLYGANEYSAASCVPGINELMVHVGYREPAYLAELERMRAGQPWRSMAEAGIQLHSYRDVACAVAMSAGE